MIGQLSKHVSLQFGQMSATNVADVFFCVDYKRRRRFYGVGDIRRQVQTGKDVQITSQITTNNQHLVSLTGSSGTMTCHSETSFGSHRQFPFLGRYLPL